MKVEFQTKQVDKLCKATNLSNQFKANLGHRACSDFYVNAQVNQIKNDINPELITAALMIRTDSKGTYITNNAFDTELRVYSDNITRPVEAEFPIEICINAIEISQSTIMTFDINDTFSQIQ